MNNWANSISKCNTGPPEGAGLQFSLAGATTAFSFNPWVGEGPPSLPTAFAVELLHPNAVP